MLNAIAIFDINDLIRVCKLSLKYSRAKTPARKELATLIPTEEKSYGACRI